MPIDKDEADEILKNCKLPYGYSHHNPGNDYEFIDIFSERDGLPISTTQEHEIAERIAKSYDLKLVYQDFKEGEGSRPEYKPVFAASCSNLDELKNAKDKIIKAQIELEEQINKI